MVFGKAKSDDPTVLMQQGQFRDAIKILHKKLRRNPTDLSIKIKLAEAYEGNGQASRAAELYIAEAEACLSSGQRSKALALFKKAARLEPENGSVKSHIIQLENPSDRNDGDTFSFDIGEEEAPAENAEPALKEEDLAETAEEEKIEAEAVSSVAPEELETTDSLQAPAFGQSSEEAAVEGGVEQEGPREEAAGKPVQGEGAEQLEALEDEKKIAEESADVAVEPDHTVTEDLPVDAAQLPSPEDFLPLIKAFFPDLEDEQARVVNSLARPLSLEAGEVLVREEEEGDSLFIITRGRLEARGRFESGEYNLALLSAGDIIGEVAFLKKVRRTATVTAAERSLVLELPGEETRKQLERHPELLAHLEAILQERVEKTLCLLKAYDKEHHGDKTR